MSRQINFYITSTDRRALELKLEEAIDFQVFAWKSDEENPMQIRLPQDGSLSSRTQKVYLTRQEMISKIRIGKIRDRNEYSIDALRSPVVEYNRGYDDNSVVRPGRFYYAQGYFNDIGIWVEKEEDFKRWADKILKITRAFFQKRKLGSFYVGEAVAEALKAGIQLSQV